MHSFIKLSYNYGSVHYWFFCIENTIDWFIFYNQIGIKEMKTSIHKKKIKKNLISFLG